MRSGRSRNGRLRTCSGDAGSDVGAGGSPSWHRYRQTAAARAHAASLATLRLCSFLMPLVVGCGHGRMVPAAADGPSSESRKPALGAQDGVWITAYAEDWHAAPNNLSDWVTPIRVRLANHSGTAIRVLYQDFALIGQRGRAYQPLPVVPLDRGDGPTPGGRGLEPAFQTVGFFVAPRYRDVYPSLHPWSAPLPRDESFYEHQLGRWSRGLPTQEMKAMALPEGVLLEEGEVAGFLYFENATAAEKQLLFVADIAEGRRAAPLVSIKIPFRVE